MTPEGRVKSRISKFLKSLDGCFYDMPVPSGFGKSTLDYVCSYRGFAFYIEAKAPGKGPTPRQKIIIRNIEASGAKVFVIDGDLSELEAWVAQVRSTKR